VEFLRDRVAQPPRVVLVLGSGLGGIAAAIANPVRVPYREVPGFPEARVAGHAGALVAGSLAGVEVVAMAGRFHLYEGWNPTSIAFPLRVLAAMGAGCMVLTNAAGAVREGFLPGDLMLVADHLDFMRRSPLAEALEGGPRGLDLSDPYDRELQQIALEVATAERIRLARGVYAAVLGPSYETPAEVRMLRRLGADAVGMSTVPETLAARSLGLRVLAISCITNAAAGLSSGKLTHDEVLQVGATAAARLARLLDGVLRRLAAG